MLSESPSSACHAAFQFRGQSILQLCFAAGFCDVRELVFYMLNVRFVSLRHTAPQCVMRPSDACGVTVGVFDTRTQLDTAISDCLISSSGTGNCPNNDNGPMGTWDTSKITDISYRECAMQYAFAHAFGAASLPHPRAVWFCMMWHDPS